MKVERISTEANTLDSLFSSRKFDRSKYARLALLIKEGRYLVALTMQLKNEIIILQSFCHVIHSIIYDGGTLGAKIFCFYFEFISSRGMVFGNSLDYTRHSFSTQRGHLCLRRMSHPCHPIVNVVQLSNCHFKSSFELCFGPSIRISIKVTLQERCALWSSIYG